MEVVVACYEVLSHLPQLGQPTRRRARVPTLPLHKLSLGVGPSVCYVPVMRTAPGPSRIPKGGRNHGQSRHSAHPPAYTVTCLPAWGNAGGQAGGLRVFSTLRRVRDELLLYASRSAPQRRAITLPERVLACVADTPRPLCRCLCHHFGHDTPASMAGQFGWAK